MSSSSTPRKKSSPSLRATRLSATSTGAARGRILIVDDEGPVARSTARAVKRDHEVAIETDSLRAQERLLSSDESFDVVICDLSMPGISGADLYRNVKAVKPDLAERFVFVTGGTFTPEAQRFLSSVPNKCLVKPFSIEGLREAVSVHLR